nr:MAG TPA: hypothetical protein [Caudoviricetes sp.]
MIQLSYRHKEEKDSIESEKGTKTDLILRL